MLSASVSPASSSFSVHLSSLCSLSEYHTMSLTYTGTLGYASVCVLDLCTWWVQIFAEFHSYVHELVLRLLRPMTFSSGQLPGLWQCWLICVMAHPALTCVGHSHCTRAQQHCILHPILFRSAALLPTLLSAWWVGMLHAGSCFLLHQRSFHSSSPALCTHAYPEQ